MAYMRLWIRLLLLLTGLVLLPILLIRAQPYRGGNLGDLLLPPPACASPCFLGVQPGTTLLADAIAILEDHPWIVNVEPTSVKDIYRINLIEAFQLNDQIVPAPLMRVDAERVTWVFWRATPVRRGDLFLELGPPPTMRVIHDQIEGTLPLLLSYPQYNLSIVTPLSVCTLTQADFWHGDSDWNGVYIGDIGPSNYFALSNTGLLLPSSELQSEAWVQELRHFEDCIK